MIIAGKPDRRIFAVSGILAMLLGGVVFAWPVMSNTIGASHPQWSVAGLSFTFTLVMLSYAAGNLIAGALSKKIKVNVILILSGILFCSGFLLASFTGDSLWTLYLGFGVMGGLAAGLGYNTVLSMVTAWFPDRQGLLSGFTITGFGLSSFIIGKVFVAVTPANGSMAWCGSFRFIGILIGAALFVLSFFFALPGKDFAPPERKTRRRVREAAMDVGAKTMIRTPSFWLFYIWLFMSGFFGVTLVGQSGGIAVFASPESGAGVIATAVGLISVLSAAGSILYGAMFDRRGHRLTIGIVTLCFAISSILLILAVQFSGFSLMIFGFMVGGIGYGGITTTASAVISDFYGRSHYSLNFSIVLTTAFFTSFASTISGRLYDLSQSYVSTTILMLIVTAIGFAVFLGIRRPEQKK